MKKTKKIGSAVLKALITLAVLMMLLSNIPLNNISGESSRGGAVNERLYYGAGK